MLLKILLSELDVIWNCIHPLSNPRLRIHAGGVVRGTQHVIQMSEMAPLCPLLMQGRMDKVKSIPRLDHIVCLELSKHL